MNAASGAGYRRKGGSIVCDGGIDGGLGAAPSEDLACCLFVQIALRGGGGALFS